MKTKVRPVTAKALRRRVEAAEQAYAVTINQVNDAIENRAVTIEARIASLESEANALATLGRDIQR